MWEKTTRVLLSTLQSRGAIALQFQKDSYPRIKILLSVSRFPTVQDRTQFLLGVPNRDVCPWSANSQTFERTETLSNIRLDPFARTPRIFYPTGWNIRPKLQIAFKSGTSA